MELADVTDSKSVGSNTVRVRPPPSAPKIITLLNEWGYYFWYGGWENPQFAGRARMRDGACTKFRKDAKPTEQAQFDTPPHFHSLKDSGVTFLYAWREGEPAICGSRKDARWRLHQVSQGCETNRASAIRQPRHISARSKIVGLYFFMYRTGRTRTVRVAQGCAMALAPSFARMRNQQSKRNSTPRHTSIRSKIVGLHFYMPGGRKNPQFAGAQGCATVLAPSFARMRNQQSKHDSTPRHTSTTTNRHSPTFLVRREGEHATCG